MAVFGSSGVANAHRVLDVAFAFDVFFRCGVSARNARSGALKRCGTAVLRDETASAVVLESRNDSDDTTDDDAPAPRLETSVADGFITAFLAVEVLEIAGKAAKKTKNDAKVAR